MSESKMSIDYCQSIQDKIEDYFSDTFLMDECQRFTNGMIEAGMNTNTICAIMKEYQTKYLFIKKHDEKLSKTFIAEMWWKLRNN